jgi:hypothetical protein
MTRALPLLVVAAGAACVRYVQPPPDRSTSDGLSSSDLAPASDRELELATRDLPRAERASLDAASDSGRLDAPPQDLAQLCPTTIALPTGKDCITMSCPSCAPFPVGCQLTFSGSDMTGCVAHAPGSPSVYFQEGAGCGSGAVSGLLFCAAQPGAALGPSNCPIPRPTPLYKSSPNECP